MKTPNSSPLLRFAPFLLVVLALGSAPPAGAENRALLIGVGKYPSMPQTQPLEGIDLDLEMMKKVAVIFGYAPSQTKVLFNEGATLGAVSAALDTWLTDGVRPKDSVLIYVSSHGTQVADTSGDETEDRLDEALTLYDLRETKQKDGTSTLAGVLLDDDLRTALAKIPSERVLVVVDACHSATATKSVSFGSRRSGTASGQVKYFPNPYLSKASVATSRGLIRIAARSNVVTLAAAADHQKSLATDRGSLFTRGIYQAVAKANDQGESQDESPTPKTLKEAADAYIAAQLGAEHPARFHPQLSGDPALLEKPLVLHPIDAARERGPFWRRVEDLVAGMERLPVKTKGGKRGLCEGELLELEIEVPRAGYLNVVYIDARDKPMVLFPNRHAKDNKVEAGPVSLPGAKFNIRAQKPHGPQLIAAFLSDTRLDLYADGEGKRDLEGVMKEELAELSVHGLRGFAIEPKSAARAGGTFEMEILPKSGCCSGP